MVEFIKRRLLISFLPVFFAVTIGPIVLVLPNVATAADSRRDIVVAVNKLPRTLEPAENTGNIEVRVHYSVFDTLLRRDYLRSSDRTSLRLMPGLAEKWHRVDERTLDVTLRQGVKFHNGRTLSVDDVVFTFSEKRLWGENSILPRGRLHFSSLKQVVKIDDRTVRFVTNYPDPLLEQKLAGYTAWVINADTWLKHNNGQADWMNTALEANRWNPVGTGPLKFKQRKKGDAITFTAHDAYFMGKPNFRTITFKEVPKRVSRIAGLVSDKYDIIVDVAPKRISLLNKYPALSARSVVLDNTHVLAFNTKSPKLSDKRLRQALSLAIDRGALRRDLWLDRNFTPNGHQLPNFGKMFNPDRAGYVFDLERAKKLVGESGYGGETLHYRVVKDYYLYSENAALMIIDMWRRVGVNAELELVDSFKQARGKGAEIYAWSNTTRLPDPVGGILISWGPNSAIQKQYKFWTPPAEFNELATVVERSSKPRHRYTAFQRALDLFEDEMPGTLLYNPLYTYGVRNEISWMPYPIYFMDFRPDVFSIE